MIWQCIIVDDEPKAHDILKLYISKTPNLHLVASCINAFEAMDILRKNKIDILFLDIKMPQLTGIEMLRSLAYIPKVIMTTAYTDYAIESFDIGVIDYLMKPISFERFIKAVNRATDKEKEYEKENTDISVMATHLFFKIDRNNIEKINITDLFFFESYGNYIKIHSEKKTYIITETMANLEKSLPEKQFIRIQKSYIINIQKIESLNTNTIKINNIELPIGKTYKEIVRKRLFSNNQSPLTIP
jgi:DNA-binding LytR/AlgR family response regulator